MVRPRRVLAASLAQRVTLCPRRFAPGASGHDFALKVMNKQFIIREGKVAAIKAEREILDRLQHPGIVELHFTFQVAALSRSTRFRHTDAIEHIALSLQSSSQP